MFQFVVTNILLISAGLMIFIFVRAIPRVEDEPGIEEKRGLIEKWVTSEMPEKMDAALNSFLAKFLRKIRVTLLKIDNSITSWLKKVKVDNGNGKSIDFKELASEKPVDIARESEKVNSN